MDAIATRTISRTMNQSEIVETAKALSNAMNDRDRLELEKKAVVDDFKNKMPARVYSVAGRYVTYAGIRKPPADVSGCVVKKPDTKM